MKVILRADISELMGYQSKIAAEENGKSGQKEPK